MKREQKYAAQFRESVEALAVAMRVGYTMEHAVEEARKSLLSIHGYQTAVLWELDKIIAGIKINRPVEELFMELAKNSGISDAMSLSYVLASAKRSGGNLPEIMEDTASVMAEKEATRNEIEVTLAGKRYEMRVMSLIPFGMIAYLRFGSPGYLDNLYRNPAGVLVMTFCLVIYGAAVYWSEKIMQIEI